MSRLGWALFLPLVALGICLAGLAFELDGSSDANAPIGVALLIAAAAFAFLAAGVVLAVSALRRSRSKIRDAEHRLGRHSRALAP